LLKSSNALLTSALVLWNGSNPFLGTKQLCNMEKVKSLFVKKDTRDVLNSDANIFEQERFAREHHTLSENGSDKYTTTGNVFLDDFAMLSKYKAPRDVSEIFETMNKLWSHDPLRTLQITVFLRLITRKTVLFNGNKLSTQRGQGLKHEFLGRLLWMACMHPDTFKKNMQYFVVAGSWKDVFDLLRYDLSYNGRERPMLDWKFMINFIVDGLADKNQSNLVKKYLPQIQCAKACNTLQKQCNTVIGKRIATFVFGPANTDEEKIRNTTDYRKLKTSGTAHDWQKKIAQQDYLHINWDTIAGRALQRLVNSKFLENHNLEEIFSNWMLNQEVAKYTGYPYELFKDGGYDYYGTYSKKGSELIKSLYPKKYQQELTNKQFMQLVEVAKHDMNRQTGFIVAMDVSGSMTSKCTGSTTMSAYSVARAMALYFSYLLKGKFANTLLAFSDRVVIDRFEGSTPLEKFYNGYYKYNACNTNFFQIAQLFGQLKAKGYPESDFPTGVVCLSDGEFDRQAGDWDTTGESDWRSRSNASRETVFEAFKKHLLKCGFSKEYVDNFKLVLWDIPNSYYRNSTPKFEALANTPNIFHMSGFDPAGIAFLTGTSQVASTPRTPEELFETAMQQELIQLLKI